MKNAIARTVVVATLLALARAADAQWYETYRPRETMYLFNYEVSNALGSFSDKFVSETSWRGFGFEGRSMVRDQLSLGLGFDFNRYSQTHPMLTQAAHNGGTISGPVYRYADQFAIRALAHYYLMRGPMQPYVGLGIGGVWSYSFQQIADLQASQDGFHFIIDPEIGLLYQLMRGRTSLDLNLAFRYTFTTSDVGRSTGTTQTISPILGLAWAY